MSYSTQKDFFNIPFMNESYELNCKKAPVKLKSYASTIDTRSWVSDEAKQSKFLSDLLTCQYPDSLGHGESECDFSSSDNHGAQSQRIGRSIANAPKGASTSKYAAKNTTETENDNDVATVAGNNDALFLQIGGDSLLECANTHLAEYQKVLKINTTLEKQLEVSKERLRTANAENRKIREILASKLDSNTAKDFYSKIQQFTAAGKFNKNEENLMLQFYQKMENMNEAYEILQAQNHYLKLLIEKLTARVTLENITTEPEQSQDIGYLQNEINSCRRECILLRQIVDDYQKLKQPQSNKVTRISEQDAENINAIMRERNSLREKCKFLKSVEQQVKELEHKTQEAEKEAADLNSSLTKKTQYINEMEREMQNMQKYYEEKYQNACLREEFLKAQLEDLKEEIIKAKCEAQRADILAMEVSNLRNEVLKRDLSLNDCDCQYKQLMDVVNELQSFKLQSLHDNQTQTCEDQTDELTFYTSATLNEIVKELKRRGSFDDEFMAAYRLEPAPGGANVEYDKHCCQEMKRLQKEVDKMKNEMQEAANSVNISEDILKRFKELESENAKLLQNNQALNVKLKEDEEKIVNMLMKIENLERNININSQEANKIEKDLQGTIDLVKDISDLQLKNQQLANAVSVINSRDDEKIIDDLRRQLEEEMAKLKKCQQDNANLLEEAKLREIDMKELKELNNRIEAERKKLEEDNNILHNVNANLQKNCNLAQTGENAERVNKSDETRYKEKNNFEKDNPERSTENGNNNSSVMSKQASRTHQEVADLKEFVASPSEVAISSKQPSRIKQEVADQEELIAYPSEVFISKQSRRTQQEAENLEEYVASPSEVIMIKQPSQIKQELADLEEFTTYPSEVFISQQPIRMQEVADLVDFAAYPYEDSIGKQPSRSQQEVAGLEEFVTGPSEYVASEQSKRTQQKGRAVDNSRLDAANKNLSRQQQKTKTVTEYETSPHKDSTSKQLSRDQQKNAVLDDFVYKKSDTLKHNLQKGRCFEKEFRNILEEFIFECSNCFGRLFNTKSKLYDICHRLCHRGIDTLSFRELAYLHKKIYVQADRLIPGCLLDMILSDHKEQIERMLMSVETPHLVDNKKIDNKISNENISCVDQKCCCCKNELCCNYSEEMLKDKVNKLEKDIGIAREYLETLRSIPLETNVATDNGDSTDTNNSTYRASSTVMLQQKSRYSKHLKKLKNRMIKHPAI